MEIHLVMLREQIKYLLIIMGQMVIIIIKELKEMVILWVKFLKEMVILLLRIILMKFLVVKIFRQTKIQLIIIKEQMETVSVM